MKKIYSIISHTHWDREWYLPFEQFRIRLVDMMDNLLDILENDECYRFHLDAQTIVIEDYLEVRPHKKADIERFVSQGRLLIGPWYVQNDFHLTSGEATVRNLLIGTEIADQYGEKNKVGYAADQFGICSQLPQILNGFGIDSCVFGRGYGRGERQFYWKTEDGSKVICEHMANWYNNLQRLPSDPEKALELTRDRANICFKNAKGSSALLMNGVDHLEAQENLTEIINGMKPLANADEEIIQDILPDYIKRLKNEISELGLELKCYEGEMRDLGQGNVLTGTLSSRIHLKQHNVRIQSDIEGRFEPQYAILDALGISEYPRDWSRYLWKTLIENHPHDSICGCSRDEVHRHMMDRNQRLYEALDELDTRADEAYMQHLDRTRVPENAVLLTCVNNSLYPVDKVFKAVIDIISGEDTGAFRIVDAKGKEVPFEVVSVVKNLGKRVLSPINLPGVKTVNRYTVIFRTKVNGMTRKTLICVPTEGAMEVTASAKKRTRNLENEYLKVKINANGSVDVLNKKNGAIYKNALVIEDNSDRNNLYCYTLGGPEELFTSENVKAKVELVKDTRLEKIRKISYTLDITRNGEKFRLPVEILLTLRSGAKQLDVSVTLDNNFKDHRTRIYFPTGIISDVNYAGQPFDTLIRKKVSDFENDEMHPNTAFVGVDGNGHGVALLNEGLYEYEHMTDENGTLALTLLRCTGIIGTYMADGKAPEGQCIGRYTLNFAVYPYSGDHVSSGVAQAAEMFINPAYVAVQHNDYNKFVGGRPFVQAAGVPDIYYRPIPHPEISLPLEKTAIKLTQNRENAMMLSAFKGANKGKGQIIRLYNTTSVNVEFSIKPGFKVMEAFLCDLSEAEKEKLTLSRAGTISLKALPKQIITVKVI
jgi:alpha-mannosidase